MGQSDSKVRKHRITKGGKEIGSLGRDQAKSSRKNVIKTTKTASRKSNKRSAKEKRKSSTLRRRFSKKNKYLGEDREKKLIGDDSLSSASVDTLDSRRIKTTVLTERHFRKKRLLDFDSSSEYSGLGYRNSTLLFSTNGSFDLDPELPDHADVVNEDTTKLGYTEVQDFDGSVIVESLFTLEPPQSQPILNEAIESSSSIVLTHTQSTGEGSSNKEMLAEKDSEVSENLLGDSQHHNGSADLECTEQPTPVFLVSASCGSLAADLNERPVDSFSGASMDDIHTKRKKNSLSLLTRLRSPRMSNKRKASVQFKLEDFGNQFAQKSKVRSKSLSDVRLVSTILIMCLVAILIMWHLVLLGRVRPCN